MASDPFNLTRFLSAQAGSYSTALGEIRSGRKRSHWIWYIFPQLAGLGSSAVAIHYAITGLDEACSYLDHAVLGARLRECAEAVLTVEGRGAHDIFGYPDELKLRSSMTLFELVTDDRKIFSDVLEKYFVGVRDDRTIDLLRKKSRGSSPRL